MATILVFAKEPLPGRVKTRLVPPLTHDEAARLATAFLRDIVNSLRGVPEAVVEIALPPGDSREAVEALFRPRCAAVDQGNGSLGDRLALASGAAFERRDGPVAVVGADHPNLPADRVEAALDEARLGRVGWVPTKDGGYAALALPRPIPGLFHGVPWSTPEVAEATRRNARKLGYALTDLPPWYDVDTVDDLARLQDDLAGDACPATQDVLATLEPPLSARTFPEETHS